MVVGRLEESAFDNFQQWVYNWSFEVVRSREVKYLNSFWLILQFDCYFDSEGF